MKFWTQEEDLILKENYSILSKKDLQSLFPNRSWDSILLRGKRVFKLQRLSFRSHPNNKYALGNEFVHPNPKKKKDSCSYISSNGYKLVKVKEYDSIKSGWEMYKPEHIYIIENLLGRKLKRDSKGKGEGIHHIDGDKLNNDPDNLLLYENENVHRTLHSQLEKISCILIKKGVIKFDKTLNKYYINE